jgi:glycosyltransferase involved in cell wall biosynthesis
MNLWARLFARVDICAPIAERAPSGNEAPYTNGSVHWIPVRYSIIPGVAARSRRLIQVPALVPTFARLIKGCDVVLLRSPSPIAMWARAVAQILGARTITKWAAGPFLGSRSQPVLARLEQYQVRRGPGPALIYGPAPESHLISFIPYLMSEAELQRARTLAVRRLWSPPWKILCVGRLSPDKNFGLALRALMELRSTSDLDWRFTLAGDGMEAAALRTLASKLGIADRVRFTGALEFADVQELYAESHCVIIPGLQEGWPKTIGEAWAHGAFPVAVAAGIQPWLIRNAGVGMVTEPEPRALASALATVLSQTEMLRAASERGPEQCRELTQERFAARLEQVLVEHLHLT